VQGHGVQTMYCGPSVVQEHVVQDHVVQSHVVQNHVMQNHVVQNHAVKDHVMRDCVVQDQVAQDHVVINDESVTTASKRQGRECAPVRMRRECLQCGMR
jgi:hypothetical protein